VDRSRSGQGSSVEGLTEPVDHRTRELLRRAVHEHAASARKGARGPVLRVGVPGERVAGLVLGPIGPTDLGLRTDVVAALRTRAGRPDHLLWVARLGGLELQDVDVEWLAAARAAYAEAQAPLTFVVVNRRGWRDPRSGLGRSWARIRPGPDSAD
jgi:hypothetical protein